MAPTHDVKVGDPVYGADRKTVVGRVHTVEATIFGYGPTETPGPGPHYVRLNGDWYMVPGSDDRATHALMSPGLT